jgi:signal transduction histidine kinase/ligand-binding sensor domain-containing protein/DNA-binding response OmpR family regulator
MINRLKYFGLFFLLIGSFLHVKAISGRAISPIKFQYYTTNEGLAQNTVDCILKDQRGFMWFGTWNGLCRYDGYSFKTYQKDKVPVGLKDNFIHALCEDFSGNIWIGTGRGLVCFNTRKEQFEIHRDLKENVGSFSINHVVKDSNNQLWVATQNNGLWRLYLNDKEEWESTKIDGGLLPDRHINHLTTLENKYLLVGTFNGIAILNLNNQQATNRWNYLKQELEGLNVQSVFQDSVRRIWLGTDEGLFLFNSADNQLSYFGAEPDNPNDLNHLTVSDIVQDNNGTVIVGTLGGLNYYNPEINAFIHLNDRSESNETLNNPFVNSLYADNLGNVWIGTEKGGVNYYNTYQKPFFSLKHEPANPNTISHNTINSIFKEGNILWVGTAGGGLNKVADNGQHVWHFEMNPLDENSISNNFVTSILRAADKNLWAGTWGGGLNRLLSKNENKFEILIHSESDPNSLCSNFVSSQLELEPNKILVGTTGGLDVFHTRERVFVHVHDKMLLENSLQVGCLLADKEDRIWVGTEYGLYRFDKKELLNLTLNSDLLSYTGFFNQPDNRNSLPGNYVISLLETKDSVTWIGTYGNGICKYVENDSLGYFVNYTEKDGLCNNVAYGMEEDQQGNIWISTDKGLSKFNPVDESFQNYYVKDGLLSDQFYWSASYASNDGMLYFGGINGLNYFSPEDIEVYPNSFKPVFTEFSIFNNPVKIGERYHSRIILDKPVGVTDKVELSYKDAVFSIEFSALDYFLPEKIRYAYKMEGVDQDWVVVPSSRRFANYTNLSGGEYLFRVKATNNDGVMTEDIAELRIVINPPFWQTAWFRFLVALFIVLMVMAYIHYRTRFLNEQKRKLEKQVKERTQKIEEQKEKLEFQAEHLSRTNQKLAERQELIEGQKLELEKQNEQIALQRDEVVELNKKVNLVNQLRLRFFTNISHEFRTPLTLIIDPLEHLMKNFKGDKATLSTLKIIDRNAQRLLHLINQLIYFRRIETGKLKLRVSRGDLPSFLQNIFESFVDLAHHQKIDYQLLLNETPSETWFDSEKLENVLYNLLSNAFKYTLPSGKIMMEVDFITENVDDDFQIPYVRIQVIDSGKGIAKENLPYIFDRFYQVDSDKQDKDIGSSGIGLALTQEIVKALHGDIRVESEPGMGSNFRVLLPYTRDRFEEQELNETAVPVEVNLEGRVDVLSEYIFARATGFEESESTPEDKTKPLVLIVEDNFDLRNFLLQTLKQDYRTLGAEDGKEGLALAKKYSPELIISDVMMPVMDGIELCSRLKKEIQTSHIPIILLTAKDMIESWVEGLETGADDYIPKPFNLQILQAKMTNLIESRRKLKRMFSNSDELSPSEVTSNTVDEEFLAKAYAVLEKNYTEPEFSASHFASEMFMSRSLLYKKIRAITDLNITDFINSFKLKKAVELIRESNQSISEIAFQVGFNDPKYFSRLFKKFYGMSPSDFLSSR